MMIFALYIFYFEFVTDILVIHSLFTRETDSVNQTEGNPAVTSAWLALSIVILTPTFMSVVDVCYRPLRTDTTSIGTVMATLKGLAVNWTNTRPLLYLWSAVWTGTVVESWQAIEGIRFLQGQLRTLPMLFLQSAMLGAELASGSTVMTSLAVSTANASFLLTVHVLGMYGYSVLGEGRGAIPIFFYFLSDLLSRILAVYIAVTAKGMTFVAVGSWLCVWLFLDGAVRFAWKLAKDKKIVDRDRSSLYVMDPSIVSTLLCVFSALPLSRNPTERKWLWWTSTLVLVSNVAWTVESTDGSSIDRTSVQLFIACVILKALLFLLVGRYIHKHKIDDDYDGQEPFGSSTFTFSNTGETAEEARKSFEWSQWYEQETRAAISKNKKVSIDWNQFQDYGPVKNRYEGLLKWLRNNERQDEFDEHEFQPSADKLNTIDKFRARCSLKGVLRPGPLQTLLNNFTGLSTLEYVFDQCNP